jgi:hypothetical protein
MITVPYEDDEAVASMPSEHDGGIGLFDRAEAARRGRGRGRAAPRATQRPSARQTTMTSSSNALTPQGVAAPRGRGRGKV